MNTARSTGTRAGLIEPSDLQALFLVWAPPTLGSSRSREFAKELGIVELQYVYSTLKRGVFSAPLRYSYQAVQTLRLLFAKRPQVVFVQSPPSIAVLFVYLYSAVTGSRYVIDAHSGALQLPYWTRPQWLHRFLMRRAAVCIVTDEYFQEMIEDGGGLAFVLKDPVTEYHQVEYPLYGDFNITVVNTFSDDEPLEEVLKAAAGLSNVRFYITGKKEDAPPQVLAQAPANVQYTGYLPNKLYYGLLSASNAVMCLTTHDHTLQCGACEALSLGKPIITSDWTLLRDYFNCGTVHVPNTSEGIRKGVLEIMHNYDRYLVGIKELQTVKRQEWKKKVEELNRLIRSSSGSVTGLKS